MESWSKDFSELLEVMAEEVEQFFADIAKDVGEMVESFFEASEEIAEQMQTVFAVELEQRLGDLIDPILEAYLGIELAVEETAQPMIHTVEPFLNDRPACVGCRHYHGQTYGGIMLVCGMHPYGWESDKCPDWQSTWQE
jgi:hypothetical protein